MSKTNNIYICQECGTEHNKWIGKCPDCGGWNTLHEETVTQIPKGMKRDSKTTALEFSSLKSTSQTAERYATHVSEFDRVCGGGIVPGSVLLVGGDPGIGKSTLLLQIAAKLSGSMGCAYISGEEGLDQIRLRARRLEVEGAAVNLAAETNLRRIIATLESKDAPKVAIIDSIQTMFLDSLESAPGTVSQVRTCTQELIHVAKKRNISLILVGHVTKEGNIAGPRVLEHMVDTVLYFEGDRNHQFRILRSVKNRFGPTDEIGVFEMSQLGLSEVENPSASFINRQDMNVSGVSVFAGMEGSRPLLVEIQTLVAPSPLATPRRTVLGWDPGRLAMIIAVLEARCGISFYGKDVYLNVAGGLKIAEPAADTAVALSLLSSLSNTPIPPNIIAFGEIGLSGEVRAAPLSNTRLKEAHKLGFKGALLPKQKKKEKFSVPSTFVIQEISLLKECLDFLGIDKKSIKAAKKDVPHGIHELG